MRAFWKDYENLQTQIEGVKTIIEQNLKKIASPAVNQVIDYLLTTEGKFLRAGLTILSGGAGGCSSSQLIEAAAAFEMLHMATLVHDDIIDDSQLRRGKQSVQNKFGRDVAVYTGDYILVRAFRFLSQCGMDLPAPLSKGVEQICTGEIMQNMNRYNKALTYKEYLRIISGKTAALFYMCAWRGAEIAQMDRVSRRVLANSAKHMGLAFQIMDDCRDYEGDHCQLKKEPCNDIQNGIYTLPIIEILQTREIPQMEEWMQRGDADKVAAAVKSSQGLRQAKTTARKYADKALGGLERLKPNESVEILKDIYLKVVEG